MCRITLHVKEDCADLLEEMELSRLIKQYSEFISFPIQLWSKQRVPKQVEDEEATKKAQEFADKKAKDEGKVCTAALLHCIFDCLVRHSAWRRRSVLHPRSHHLSAGLQPGRRKADLKGPVSICIGEVASTRAVSSKKLVGV